MAEWILAGEPTTRRLGDGHPPLRPALPLAELHAEAREGGLRDLLRHPLPRPRAPGRTAAARLERLRLARRARRGVRREVGLGAGQLVRVERGRRRRVAAPARLGGDALVAGDRRRAPRHARARRRCSTSPRSPSSRSRGRARPSFLERLCDNRVAREVGAITYTQMLNRRGGIECDFTVTRRRARSCSRSSPARRSATTTSSWIRRHAARRRQRPLTDVTSRWACFALWGPRAREILAPLTPPTRSTSPTCDARDRRSATCRCARCA